MITFCTFTTVNLGVLKEKTGYYHTAGIRFDDPPHARFSRSIRFILVELGKFTGEIEKLIDKKAGWCYLLKHSHNMDEWEFEIIKSKGEDMKHTVERLQTLSENPNTRLQVEAFEKQRQKHYTEKLTAEKRGEKRGREVVALQMLAKGLDTITICECTGLTGEQVEALKKQDESDSGEK